LCASVAQLVLNAATERQWQRSAVTAPLERPALRLTHRVLASGGGILVPLALHCFQMLTSRHARRVSLIAALVTLVGAYAERAVVVFAGNASADRPADYFSTASQQ